MREVYKYYKKRDVLVQNGKNHFSISAEYLTMILKDAGICRTKATANKHLNYLCCLGFFIKPDIFQMICEYNVSYFDERYDRYISVYTFRKYKRNELEKINANARLLLDNKITPGNISKKQLLDCPVKAINDMAHLIHTDIFNDDLPEWHVVSEMKILNFIADDIEQNGYSTKQRIYDNVQVKSTNNSYHIDKLLKSSQVLWRDYIYKRPSNEEKVKYNHNSDKFIIIPKEI